jgi:hypothetical protein
LIVERMSIHFIIDFTFLACTTSSIDLRKVQLSFLIRAWNPRWKIQNVFLQPRTKN